MRILLAGGAGEVGVHLTEFFLGHGHEVLVLDKASLPLAVTKSAQLVVIQGDLQDKPLVQAAMQGVDVAVNLAWSFADDAVTIFQQDLVGHVNLLEAAVERKVGKFFYASTATVYGLPQRLTITERHPCLLQQARKPLYALGKYAAEQLCHIYHIEKKLPITLLRFWWAFGNTIGGKHLRALIRTALAGEQLQVVAGCGGSFVTMADLASFILAAAVNPVTAGGVYNIGSLYLKWSEIVAMIIEEIGSSSAVIELPSYAWNGPAFLNEKWNLSWAKARQHTGYNPAGDADSNRKVFRLALARCIEEVKSGR